MEACEMKARGWPGKEAQPDTPRRAEGRLHASPRALTSGDESDVFSFLSLKSRMFGSPIYLLCKVSMRAQREFYATAICFLAIEALK